MQLRIVEKNKRGTETGGGVKLDGASGNFFGYFEKKTLLTVHDVGQCLKYFAHREKKAKARGFLRPSTTKFLNYPPIVKVEEKRGKYRGF